MKRSYMVRVFIAIDLPDEVKDSLMPLRSKIRGAKWVERAQMHLTLRFIGEVTEFKLKEITEALDQIFHHPFGITLNGVGHFASKVLMAQIDPCEDLDILKEKIDQKLLEIGLGLEVKKFKPHITLARVKGGNEALLASFLQMHALFRLEEFKVDKFNLYSSNLTQSGAVHTVESEFFL